MAASPVERRGVDRRRQPRGGRRTGDQPGTAPLILVADENQDIGAVCEAILAKLRFAVGRVHGASEVLPAVAALRPDLVVALVDGADRLAAEMRADRQTAKVPLIVLRDGPVGASVAGEADGYLPPGLEPAAVIEEIRRVLRSRRVSSS